MTYNKPYLTVPQQRALLESRGMLVPDIAKAEEYLRRIGYYRLSAYWHPFRKLTQKSDGSFRLGEDFKPGTEFKHATDLYAFDKALRLLALDAIERIEISIRTEVALAVGRHDPWAHRDSTKLDRRFTSIQPGYTESRFQSWVRRLDEKATQSKEEFADHFRTKYANDNMPIWIAVELLDFGPLSHFLSGMRYPDLQHISSSYGGLRPDLIKSWCRSLSVVRNTSAHHARLWNKPLVDQPRLPRPGEVPDLDHVAQSPGNNRRIYAALCIMNALLKTVNPRTKWADRLKAHISTFPEAPNVSIKDAGFPNNWDQLPLWN